jgi:hypothetical protein
MSSSPSRPVLLYIQQANKETVLGYLGKSSRDPSSGGGQKDLRIRRPNAFEPVMSRIFPNPDSQAGKDISTGTVYWIDSNSAVQSVQAEYWPPYSSKLRGDEKRVARTGTIGGWFIDEAEFQQSAEAGERWFYLLVLDVDGRVWARTLREKALPGERQQIREFILRHLRATRRGSMMRAALDLETGAEYP